MEIRVKEIMEPDMEGNDVVIHELDFSIPEDIKFLEVSNDMPKEMIDYIKIKFNLHGEIQDTLNRLRGTIILYKLRDWEVERLKAKELSTRMAQAIEKEIKENGKFVIETKEVEQPKKKKKSFWKW